MLDARRWMLADCWQRLAGGWANDIGGRSPGAESAQSWDANSSGFVRLRTARLYGAQS
jgi:hypothetical protein